jgi:DtxR family transcriptional regulator, Mn-dependent transcriptional regulator
MLSRAAENYIRIIYDLAQKKGYARPGDIAVALNVSAPSVSEMLTKLAKENMVEHEKRGAVTLTEEGKKKALAIKARYQILLKLFKMAGVSHKTAYLDACRIEDNLSEETISKLVEFVERLEKTQLCKKI